MRYRRQSLLPRLLMWLFVLAGIGFVGLKWGGQGLAWVSANLLAGRSTPAPVDGPVLAQAEDVSTQQASQPASNREVELALMGSLSSPGVMYCGTLSGPAMRCS